MNPPRDPRELRETIPALERSHYLNWGAGGPSPRRVVEAAEESLEHHEYEAPAEEGMYPATFDVLDEAREAVAELLGATADEIALTNSTTDGINRVAGAFEWDAGDVVVRTDLEHSAGILPWQRLEREYGVEVRVLETEEGRIDPADLEAAVDGATLVCVSSLTWTHGTRLPIAELVEIARDAGARVLVDAVQQPGQLPIDVEEWGADFVVGAGHKWLLGPFGAGFLYVRDGAEAGLAPGGIGYRSVEEPDADDYRYGPGARRFEVGTVSPAPYAGLVEAIDLYRDVGVETVANRIESLTDRLKDGVPDDRLLSPREFESGLVTISVDDTEATVDRLGEEGVVLRTLPGRDAIRASVHAVNSREDVDALLDGPGLDG